MQGAQERGAGGEHGLKGGGGQGLACVVGVSRGPTIAAKAARQRRQLEFATRSRFSPQLIAARFSPRHMANRGEKSRSARGCCTAQTAERSVPIRPCCVHVLPFSSDRCRRSHLWTRTACTKMAGSSRRSRRTSIPYPRSLASNPLRDRWPAPGNSGQAQGDAVTWNHATPHPTSRAHPPRRRNPALRARLLRRLRP